MQLGHGKMCTGHADFSLLRPRQMQHEVTGGPRLFPKEQGKPREGLEYKMGPLGESWELY